MDADRFGRIAWRAMLDAEAEGLSPDHAFRRGLARARRAAKPRRRKRGHQHRPRAKEKP